MKLFHGSNMEIEDVGPVDDDTVGLLIRQFSQGTIDAEYLKREFDFGKLTNQYTFHTEKSLKYLKTVGIMYDESAAGKYEGFESKVCQIVKGKNLK